MEALGYLAGIVSTLLQVNAAIINMFQPISFARCFLRRCHIPMLRCRGRLILLFVVHKKKMADIELRHRPPSDEDFSNVFRRQQLL